MPVTRYKTVTNSGECFDLHDYNIKYCFGVKKDCSPTSLDWILVECGKRWCEVMTDIDNDYTQPFIPGDLIQFQYRIDDAYNEDPDNPIAGWGEFVQAQLYSPDGTLLYSGDDLLPFISRAMVAVKGGNSYQIIEIDTQALSDVDVYCWYLAVTAYNSIGDQSTAPICTETFKAVTCDDETVLVQGLYDKADCLGNYYGEPDTYVGDKIIYNNSMRFRGYVMAMPTNTEIETVLNSVKSVAVTENWLLVIYELLPTNIEKLLYLQLTAGSKLFIDNVEYACSGGSSELIGRMFKAEIPLFKQCTSSNQC